MTTDPSRLMRFVLEMRQAGVTDARALSALERTPRTHYAPEHLEGLALDDVGLPLAHAQTMTKPSIVGRMLAALAPAPGETVLEIGTGSGFQAAAISAIANKVVTLDRWSDLTITARGKFGTARLMRTYAHTADGFVGWPEEAPYDRIIVNAALEDFPEPLLAQLKPGGTMVAPLGDAQDQRLVRIQNGVREDLGPIRLQPLERGLGEGLRSG
ncbi:MAG: protein-L-isoaspartate O-methyltransferase [Hyphomonadaceae bacterium]